MKVLSLFSGVGGFDLGLERAGMETVFQCEWDKHATRILERHWPDVPRWGDVSTLTGAHVLQHAPIVDVVAWGSPCQDLSVAGKRAGLGGERSGLFHEGVRIIKEMREITNGKYPRISIWENVAGALSSSDGADFGQVLYEMDEAGACFSEWRLLDAQYFGVPQRRRRVFLVSVFDSATAARCPDPLLPLREGVQWNPATSTTQRQDTPSEIARCLRVGSGVGERGDGSDNLIVGELASGSEVAGTLESVLIREREGKAGGGKGPLYGVEKSHSLIASNDQKLFVDPIGFSHTQGLSAQPSDVAWPTLRKEGSGHAVAFQPGTMIRMSGGVWNEIAPTLRAEAKRGDNEPHVAIQYDGYNQKINDTDVSVTLRIGRDSSDFVAQPVVAPSLTASNDPSRSPQSAEITQQVTAVHEATMAVRRLTPVECERLMGWPDGWTDGQADTHRYKQCGNGVASPVAQWIGQQLMELDR